MKRYLQFVNETYFGGFSSRGEWIEELTKNDLFAKDFISDYLYDTDPKIKISNAINCLPIEKQEEILNKILKNKKGDYKNQDPSVRTHVNLNHKLSKPIGGKWMFNCFLKIITSLGQKDIKSSKFDINSDFVLVFLTEYCDTKLVESNFKRYKFFDLNIDKIPLEYEDIKLYYGINNDNNFEYGIWSNGKWSKLGEFGLTNSTFNYLLQTKSVSSKNLKELLLKFDYVKIRFLSKVKKIIKNSPIKGIFPKKMKVGEGILEFYYFGLNGEREEILDILKDNLKNWKECEKILINTEGDINGGKILIKLK